MATMASALAEYIQEKVLCHWCKQLVPFTHVRPLDACPSQCSMHSPSAVGAPYEANLQTNHEMCVQLLPSKPQ